MEAYKKWCVVEEYLTPKQICDFIAVYLSDDSLDELCDDIARNFDIEFEEENEEVSEDEWEDLEETEK